MKTTANSSAGKASSLSSLPYTPESSSKAQRDALILQHLEWARGIARSVARQLPTWFVYEDLVGPAEIALCQMAARFDPSRGVPFAAFAQRRVYGACYSSVRRKEYRERAHISLDASTRDQTSNPKDHGPAGRWQRWEATAGERDTQESPDDLIAADKAAILGAIWHLPSRHQKIITLHYLRGFAIQDIARQMGLSSPRISQLHREALAMLRPAAERMK